MFDQLKAIWKCLLCVILLSPVWGEKSLLPALDSVRVVKEEGTQLLQTKIQSYVKNGVTLDLVGVIHIGEQRYYERMNKTLSAYDAVFYEMVGEGKPPKPGAASRVKENVKGDRKAGSEMEVVTQMYSLYNRLLGLSLQKNVVDYHQDHFIHADMSLKEFTRLQEERGETLMSFAVQSLDMSLLEDVDQSVMMGAMITGDSKALKKEFIKILGSADEAVDKENVNSVVIQSRNKKCLSIMQERIREDLTLKRVAIFYGAAHLPDFDVQLVKNGWGRRGSEWLTAWEVEE